MFSILKLCLVAVITSQTSVGIFHVAGGSYELVISNARLPLARSDAPAFYDGDDSIYILGGLRNNYNLKDIVRYSISTESVQQIGSLPSGCNYGSAVFLGNLTFLYIGGFERDYYSEIWKINANVEPPNISVVANLPYGTTYTSAVFDGAGEVYINGGGQTSGDIDASIFRYSLANGSVQVVTQMPTPRMHTTAIWDNLQDSVYIFGGYGGTTGDLLDEIMKYDAREETVSTLTATLPIAARLPSAIWTGREAYVIGGFSDVEYPGVIRFNPSTEEVTSVAVRNFPAGIYATGSVYVEKLNRIYILGGIYFGSYRDQIAYFDLDSRQGEVEDLNGNSM